MDDSAYFGAASIFDDDHVASWATMGLNSSAVLSRATSPTIDTMDDTRTVCPGEIDDLLAVRHTGGFPNGASRSRAVFVDRSILDSMTHFPRDKAAQTLGLSATTFKKVCRRAGLKGWPYRRPLLGTTLEGDVPRTLSRRSSAPSAFQESHLQTSRTFSSPGRCLSAFSPAAAQQTAPQPTMPLRCVNLCSPSFSSSSSSSSFATSDVPFSYLAPSQAPTPEQSTHVVDAVLDYLDTPSAVCSAAHDMAAVYLCELEAVVEGLDLEG